MFYFILKFETNLPLGAPLECRSSPEFETGGGGGAASQLLPNPIPLPDPNAKAVCGGPPAADPNKNWEVLRFTGREVGSTDRELHLVVDGTPDSVFFQRSVPLSVCEENDGCCWCWLKLEMEEYWLRTGDPIAGIAMRFCCTHDAAITAVRFTGALHGTMALHIIEGPLGPIGAPGPRVLGSLRLCGV